MCEDKQILTLTKLFCELANENPTDYYGFSVLTRSNVEKRKDDFLFCRSWRHAIPIFEALPQLEQLGIMHSDLNYTYFVLPEEMTEQDLNTCAAIYNNSFLKDPKCITGKRMEIRGLFHDRLLNSLRSFGN